MGQGKVRELDLGQWKVRELVLGLMEKMHILDKHKSSSVNMAVGANGKEFCAAFSNQLYSNSCQIVQFNFMIL